MNNVFYIVGVVVVAWLSSDTSGYVRTGTCRGTESSAPG